MYSTVLYDKLLEFGFKRKTDSCVCDSIHADRDKIVNHERVLVMARLHDDFNNIYFYVMTDNVMAWSSFNIPLSKPNENLFNIR